MMKHSKLSCAVAAWFAASGTVVAFVFTPHVRCRSATCSHMVLATEITESLPWTKNKQAHGDFDQEDWGWVYTTVPDEAVSSYVCNDIEGDVPQDLQGTYYKAGPGNFEREGERFAHVLDGDGFVTAFSFDNGHVRYTGRFVETEYFLAEQERDAVLYRNVFGTQPKGGPLKNAFDLTLKNVANTNVIHWGGRLFALWEAGRPYELDPVTLETVTTTKSNQAPFDQKLLGNHDCGLRGVTIDQGGPVDQLLDTGRFFTAHPRVLNDRLVGFATAQDTERQVTMTFVEFDSKWKEQQRSDYTFANGSGAPHDFAIGNKHYAFFQNQLTLDQLPYILGLKSPTQIMRLQLERSTILHLAPRTAGAEPVQFEVPPYFVIHTLPILEEDGKRATIYTNGWDLKDERYFPQDAESMPFLGAWGGRFPEFGEKLPPTLLYRTTVDLATKKVICHEQVLPGLVVDFMMQDERYPHLQYMSISNTDGDSLPSVGFAQVNTATRSAEYWWAEPRTFTGELQPVAKTNGAPGSWLLGLVYDRANRRTSLYIFDSERFSSGPIARVHLPHHVSYGVHGFFARRE